MGNARISGRTIAVCIYATFVLVSQHYRKNGPCTLTHETNKFKFISYPPDLGNAELVGKLRSSKPVSISPINLNYKNIQFSSLSMHCSREHKKKLSILILIKTRPWEVNTRMKLREDLQNQTKSLKLDAFVQHGFLIGQSKKNITDEITKYGDFVIGDFADTYRNLTYESMMGLKWAMEQCQDFNFYVSLDVDTRLFLNNLNKFLKDPCNYPNVTPDLKFEQAFSSRVDFYAGNFLSETQPVRSHSNKWYLSEEDYPSSVFPPYISGMAIIFSKETIANFHFLSPYVKHMSIDDVYFGILANKLGIIPTDISELITYGTDADEDLKHVLVINSGD